MKTVIVNRKITVSIKNLTSEIVNHGIDAGSRNRHGCGCLTERIDYVAVSSFHTVYFFAVRKQFIIGRGRIVNPCLFENVRVVVKNKWRNIQRHTVSRAVYGTAFHCVFMEAGNKVFT